MGFQCHSRGSPRRFTSLPWSFGGVTGVFNRFNGLRDVPGIFKEFPGHSRDSRGVPQVFKEVQWCSRVFKKCYFQRCSRGRRIAGAFRGVQGFKRRVTPEDFSGRQGHFWGFNMFQFAFGTFGSCQAFRRVLKSPKTP